MTNPPADTRNEGGTFVVPPFLFRPFRLPAKFYANVLDSKVSFAARTLVIRIAQTEEPTGKVRMGVVTGKKTLRFAVQRSRARRLLREAFRLIRPELKIDFDLVLIGRHPLVNAKLSDVQKDLRYVCRKAGLLS